MLAACDIYRPAAIDQLKVLGEQIGVPVFEKGTQKPEITAKQAVSYARDYGHDYLLLDTAGRLHIDTDLMEELRRITKAVEVDNILLVIDSMIGQDSVNIAKAFNEILEIDGVILTKLDGDTRGGAALSIRYVTGKPIKFVGTGEKLDTIEPFYPDRMASRILGMGDVLTLIDKAQAAFDEKQAIELEQKMRQQTFTLDDYLTQLAQLKSMGNLDQLMGMMPGVKPGALKDAKIDEKALAHTEAIIHAMTKKEREKPDIINASRKKRIAAGSGTSVEEVNKVLKQFEQMLKMMKQFSDMGKTRQGKKMLGRMKMPF
jgi:signal recognition particle subunit SRP54